MGEPGVRVEVLGPIRVLDAGGADVTPHGALQRRLLALLVVSRGRVVTVDAAVDALWPGGGPHDPVGALQNHVSRLRGALPAGAVASVGDGYQLGPAAVDVDADRLASLLAENAAWDAAAVATVDGVLRRWSGPAYPELADVDDGRAAALAAEDLRTRAREAVAAWRLAHGRLDGVVAELTALAGDEPLRERPRALLMEALAASGRHADALRAYDDFRRLLGDELGTAPSPSLTARHAALLAADPRPAGPPTTAPGAVRSAGAGPEAAGVGGPRVGRLPAPVTSLLGREAMAGEVVDLVAGCRLVTLVGPGGVGKTRLLLEVGRRLQAEGPGRAVVLCELATADTGAGPGAGAGGSAGSVATVVAAALGIDRRPGVGLPDQVASVLGDAEVVLLLDNCEHVVEPAAELTERLLARCPRLRVVATSRERLRVPGEHVRTVPVLPADDAGAPAVRLFVERASAATGGFAPTPGDLATIGDIVRRLDGLPLAIELAAARLHTHGLDEVAAGLDHRFDLLTTGHRTSTRHASLGAAVSWSYDVLDDRLQDTFAALSVFATPFTAADAAAVCALEDRDAAARLAELCERSLVARTPPGPVGPDRRFTLLETLRAFGDERLVAGGRADLVRARHARHQVAWAERADRRLLEPGGTVIAEVDAALPGLEAALRWALRSGEAELAGRLVVALLDYGLLRLRPDVLAWCEQVVELGLDDGSPVAPRAWSGAAYAAWMAGDLDATGARSARAREAAERAGGDGLAEAATISGNHALFQGRLDTALTWYRRADAAALVAGDVGQHLVAAATELLALGYAGHPATSDRAAALLAEVGDTATPHAAHAWYCAGEAELATAPGLARERFTRALAVAEATGAALITGLAGTSRASLEARDGDPARAAADYRRLIDHWRRAGMWSTQWTMLRSIAALLDRLGRPRDAAVLLGAVRGTRAGHRVFGPDEVALADLDRRLRRTLGPGAHEEALAEGAALDGDAAIDHAWRAL